MSQKRELQGRTETTMKRGYPLHDRRAFVEKIVHCVKILRIILKYFVKICNL